MCWVNIFIKCLFNKWAAVLTGQMDFSVIVLIMRTFSQEERAVRRCIWWGNILTNGFRTVWSSALDRLAQVSASSLKPEGPAVTIGAMGSFLLRCLFFVYSLPPEPWHPQSCLPHPAPAHSCCGFTAGAFLSPINPHYVKLYLSP